jgi:hypothetical protein
LGDEFAGNKEVRDLKCVAQFLRGHSYEILRARRAADGVMNHAAVWQKEKPATSRRRPDF